ncbi:MAG: AAA family ATPase, partial [Pseudoclavibacter sp.]|nr:AAA family ATPase [Pseudoclavibacter sp.]
MHLKSLTIKGFKSFANPTKLVFEPGVTCVVGPNGSGKSNVVDALAWVMGEQGAKSLRGGKMEDVIFAGTATRGPLGRAEVTLTIDNADGLLPIEYSEVTIRRTLFRNGGSEYAINGAQARLLDVQELLSDTGLGREMHVIVGQGRLDGVLHATPEDRRGFVEEAAGILKHRRRKERTVRKLDGMEANLTRLKDLTSEVRRQLGPLGRQAEIARRAHGIAAIARDAKARLMADDAVRLGEELAAAQHGEQERRTERAVLQEKLQRAVERIEGIVSAQRGDAVDRARRIVFELESVHERLRNLQMLAAQRQGLLASRLETPAFTPSVSAEAVEQAEAECERLREQAEAAEGSWREAQEATGREREALDALDARIAAQSALLSQHELRGTRLQGQLDAAASKLAAVRGEVLRQRNARDAAAARMREAAAALDELLASAERGEADSTGLDEAHRQAQLRVADAEAEVELRRERQHELERERDALQARIAALALADRAADATEALLAAQPAGVHGTVSEAVRVQEGAEAAIAAALGTLAEAVLVADEQTAFDVLEYARAGEHGRLELLREDAAGAAEAGTAAARLLAAAGRAGAVPAASLLRSAPPALARLLAGTAVAEDLAQARRVLAAVREHAGDAEGAERFTVVTRDGQLATPLLVRGGSGTAGSSRIEIAAERERAEARLARASADIDRGALELAECRGALRAAKEEAVAALEALRAFDAELARRREQLNRAQARSDAAVAEHDRAGKGLAQASAGVEEAQARAEEAKRAVQEHAEQPKPELDASGRGEQQAAVERAREREVEARLRLETLRERIRAESGRAEQLRTRLEQEREAAERAAREAVLRRAELRRTRTVLGAVPPVLDSLSRSLEQARADLARSEREREEQNAELARLRGQEGEHRARLAAISEDVHALEMQIYEKRLQRSAVPG